MSRVLSNLLSNATDACAGSKNAEIRAIIRPASFLRPWIEVGVVDNGPGIADGIKDQIFDPFFTHGKHNGTGLGLALAKYIVQAHGGRIRAENTATGGAAFYISIPAGT